MKLPSITGFIFLLFLLQIDLYSSIFEDNDKNLISNQTNQLFSYDNILINSLPSLLSNGGSSKVNYPNK
ncbi:MAG: hypothetical protein K8R74_06175, partial [Bacteroidales bacterium]|nr:hypothetical protein [Bacteroidales bacterium]